MEAFEAIMSLGDRENCCPPTIIPDPHGTWKDSGLSEIVEHNATDASVDEEILRPNLRAQSGATGLREIESLFESLLSSEPARSERQSRTHPKFPVLDKGSSKGTPKRGAHREWEALHFAAQKGNAALCKAFIERGALVDSREDDNWTPLILAAQNGHLEVCRILLDAGANPNASGDSQRTPLLQAVQGKHIEVVKLLLSRGADVSQPTKRCTLVMAVVGIKPDSDEGDKQISLEIAKLLIDAGADINEKDVDEDTPLKMACGAGFLTMAEFLLTNGADPNTRDSNHRTCLHITSFRTNPDIIKLLTRYGADVNAVGDTMWTSLHFVTQLDKERTFETVQTLIQAGADVNISGAHEATPLYPAVQANGYDVVELLLNEGAHPDTTTIQGVTPLVVAIRGSNLDVVNLLLAHKARTDILDENGFNIVHSAAMQDSVEVLKRVLETGADKDLISTDERNLRPIHLASQNKNDEISMTLLEYGAKV
ncbi:ankyrin repeat-containing domain protein [Hypoxylon trugodes]|uniref:ankyrin repeat-containing domain protein n=1 Tax=Hypoxylon trugodes TaxID=326681 RepID=UPI00218E7B63|nr:ankyrin repeat-containing domain protein [Hypoxylon trugodes]KAI1390554.1 ankyrin repeat-containing domain protein [Hypoxylon trugodes]